MAFRAKDPKLARAGLPLGLALAALAVTGWIVPPGDKPSGAATSMTVGSTGVLGVEPAGQIARTRDLRAGDDLVGRFALTNQSGKPQAVSLRVALPSHDLDGQMQVEVMVDGRVVVDGSLGSARAWRRVAVLRPGRREHVRVRMSLPPGASGYEYRRAETRIELQPAAGR